MTIIVAGHETTASTLNMIWYLLSQNPEVAKELSAEVEYLTASQFPEIRDLSKFSYTRLVIDEALRLYPPGWLMTRRALKDDHLGSASGAGRNGNLYLPVYYTEAPKLMAGIKIHFILSVSSLRMYLEGVRLRCCHSRQARETASVNSLLAPKCKCTYL